MFDLTRTCDDKQRIHIPKAVEMTDCDSADRGSSDSLVRGGNRIQSGITRHTTSRDRSCDHRVYFTDDPPTAPPDPDISVPPPTPVPASDFIEPEETRRVIKTQWTPASLGPIWANTASRIGKCEGVRAQRAAAGLPI